MTRGHATFTESLASITDGLGTRTEGGVVSGAQAADSDPNAPGATYGTTSDVAGTGGTVSSTSGSTSMVFVAPAADTGRADVAVSAGGSSVCPPPSDWLRPMPSRAPAAACSRLGRSHRHSR